MNQSNLLWVREKDVFKIYDIQLNDANNQSVKRDVLVSDKLFLHVMQDFLEDTLFSYYDNELCLAINNSEFINNTEVIKYQGYEINVRFINVDRLVDKTPVKVMQDLFFRYIGDFKNKLGRK